jgi:hypothetical protein
MSYAYKLNASKLNQDVRHQPQGHKDVPQLIHQRFTPSFNLCPSSQMDVLY